jgi:hypothetical protein
MTSCLKTTEHRFWTMRIEAYYKLSMVEREPDANCPFLVDAVAFEFGGF